MSSTASPTENRPTRASQIVLFVAIFAAIGVSAFSGYYTTQAASVKHAMVLPLAVAVALVLSFLALTRFGTYVVIMLLIRSSIDITKLSKTGIQTGTGPQSGTGRALDPSTIFAIVFIVFGIIWLAMLLREHGKLPGSPLRTATLAWLASGAISILGSERASTSAVEALRMTAIVIMFVVLEQLMIRTASLKRIYSAVLGSAAFPLLFTLFGFMLGHPRTEKKGSYFRIVGTFNQSNAYGRYLMFMIIAGVAIFPFAKGHWRKALAVGIALAAMFLPLTYTRTALVGAWIGLVLVAVTMRRRRLLAVLVGATLAALIVVPGLAARLGSATQTASSSGVGTYTGQVSHTGNSLIWRLNYWTEVLPLANSNPVTGIGLALTQYNTDQAKQPHNDYIRAYVETGVLGLLSYLWLLCSMVNLGIRAIRTTIRGTFEHAVGAAWLGCAVAFVAVSAASNAMTEVVNMWYMFAIAAAASAVVHRAQTSPDTIEELLPAAPAAPRLRSAET